MLIIRRMLYRGSCDITGVCKRRKFKFLIDMGKYVENWFVREYPNGVFEVTFNVTSRCVKGWAFNDTCYGFDDEDFNSGVSEIVDIPKFLPNIDGIFVQSQYQEKDQIVFMYNPVFKAWFETRQIKTILQGQ